MTSIKELKVFYKIPAGCDIDHSPPQQAALAVVLHFGMAMTSFESVWVQPECSPLYLTKGYS